MRKLGLALCLLLLGLAPAQPQAVSWPPPAGTIAFLCVYNSVLPTLTTGQISFVQCDENGQILTSGGGGGGDVNLTEVGGAAIALGQGLMAASLPVAIASNQSAVPASQSGTWTVQPGNTANTTPWLITPNPSSAAGAATTSASSTAAASNLVLKASAGNLYNLTVTIGATTGYLMLFDATSLPSNGAVTPVFCYPIISNGTLGAASFEWSTPKRFDTGITAGFSTTGCFTLTASATGNFFGGYQ